MEVTSPVRVPLLSPIYTMAPPPSAAEPMAAGYQDISVAFSGASRRSKYCDRNGETISPWTPMDATASSLQQPAPVRGKVAEKQDRNHHVRTGQEVGRPCLADDKASLEVLARRAQRAKQKDRLGAPGSILKAGTSAGPQGVADQKPARSTEHEKSMGDSEKLRCAIELKDEADQFYNNHNFEEAARLYNDCIVAVDGLQLRGLVCVDSTGNFASCLLEMGEYERCIQICDIALGVNAKCAKALYQRGLAQLRLVDTIAARVDFEASLQEAMHAREQMEYGEEARALEDLIRRVNHHLAHLTASEAMGMNLQTEYISGVEDQSWMDNVAQVSHSSLTRTSLSMLPAAPKNQAPSDAAATLAVDPARMSPLEIATWFQERGAGAESALRRCMLQILLADGASSKTPSTQVRTLLRERSFRGNFPPCKRCRRY